MQLAPQNFHSDCMSPDENKLNVFRVAAHMKSVTKRRDKATVLIVTIFSYGVSIIIV